MYDFTMKPGQKNKKDAHLVLDMIEHYQKRNTTEGVTTISGTQDFDLDFDTFDAVVRDLQTFFKDEIEIVNIYDSINEEHWLNPPMRGYPEHRPVAELRIKGPVGKLRSLVESEYKSLVSNKIEIIIDKKHGLYMKSHPDRSYELQHKTKNVVTKRYRLIEKLIKAKRIVSGPKLRGELGYETISLVGQEIKKINNGCREKAGLFDDLISHQNTGGYEINSRYSISLK